jgi:hypothetical protein
VITWSVVAGLLGVFGSGAGVVLFGRRRIPSTGYWLLGLTALLPAWVFAFWGLLGSSVGRTEVSSSVSWILSSSAGLLGVIITDAVARHLREVRGDQRPLVHWVLGVAALGPAWGIALVGLAWIRH